MNKPDPKAIEAALREVNRCDELAASEAFTAFISYFQKTADDLADSVLHGNMDAADRDFLRIKRLGILEVLNRAGPGHRAAQCRILHINGETPKFNPLMDVD